MPLSENEQKMLDQMEQALYAEDPRFASQMRGARGSGPSRKRVVIGGLVAVLGLALVIGGVAGSMIWLGVAGFLVMVGGMAWAFTSAGSGRGNNDGGGAKASPRPNARKKSAPGAGGSFSSRLEDRWEKRRRENGM